MSRRSDKIKQPKKTYAWLPHPTLQMTYVRRVTEGSASKWNYYNYFEFYQPKQAVSQCLTKWPRNKACFCKSGKKFKNCCRLKDRDISK